MKRILFIFFTIAELVCLGQAKISMSPAYSIMPNDTVNFGDSVHISVYIKNTGNTAFSGALSVQAKRDTTFGVTCGSSSLSVAGFQPGDSIPTVLTFTPTGGTFGFKVAGNGNTIVVWPIVTGALTGDSVRPILWIDDVNSIYEFPQTLFQLYPNPAIKEVHIKSDGTFDTHTIVIYDAFARKIKELSFRETVDVSDLFSGTYWFVIITEKKVYRIQLIKE